MLTSTSYDALPSILSHPITSSITRSSSGEADSKRAKLTPPNGPTTISSLIQDGSYETLQALEKDVESATTEILASSGTPTSPEDTALQGKVLAFQTILKDLVGREEARNTRLQEKKPNTNGNTQASKDDGTPVPIKEEEQEPEAPPSRTVLTLYGSAPPKQLFSSLQQPHRVSPANGISTIDTAVKVTLPLRETNLPNLITTTEVYPLAEPDTKEKKVATVGEVFRAPAHLPQLSPPKSTRPTTSKGNSTITFAHQEAPKPRRKASQSYAHQNLSSGFWLGYGGVDMPKDQTSLTAKQKSRQRALSMGEAQQPPSEAILVAVQQAKEDALFRSAYSSFAPSRDDASAIIPEETKNMVWWQKVGEKRFNEMFPIDPALLGPEEATNALTNGTTDEDEQFKEAVENFTPLEADVLPGSEEKSEEEKDTDEVLKEISEMLETLASHQRIRNLSLTTNPRTPVVQNASLATLAGSPSTPSSEEFDVYQILKSQLTLLISQLPPYAVAKLNGDQMDELNISRTILFDTKEYKGVLEEDQLAKLAKAPAVPVAPPATLARTSSGTNAHYPASSHHQFSRPAPSVPQSGARPVYPQQTPLHRSSSMHLQRSPSGAAQTFQPGGPSYAPAARPAYSATPSYSQQTPRPSYGTTPSGQYFPQRSAQPSSYGAATGSQYYGSTPQAQTQNRYATQQNQSSFYPRSQNVAPLYNGGQAPPQQTASPMKAAPAPSNYGTRQGYGTPVSGGQMRSMYHGPPQYATPQAPAATASYNGMPTNPQQMMLDRQQAQVAAQSQARLAAQSSLNSFSNSRAGSGTPQPPNGSMYGANGSSMST
jgi:hypothetical protein